MQFTNSLNRSEMDIGELFTVATAQYRPPPYRYSQFYNELLPMFTLRMCEHMQRDYQVQLGMWFKSAPQMRPKFTLSGDPQVVEFVAQTLRTIWIKAMPKITSAFWNTRAGGEVIYKYDESDQRVKFDGLRDIYPSDMKILTQGGKKWGLRVHVNPHNTAAPGVKDHTSPAGSVVLPGPKSFVYVHRREYGSWDGRSDFESAYESWLEKSDQQGARKLRRLWGFKLAFGGHIIMHPKGSYTVDDGQGNKVTRSYRDAAREAVTAAASGAVWTFPMEYDAQGRELWKIIPPAIYGEIAWFNDWIGQLDIEILRGIGIPDDILSADSGTAGFADRTIPLHAFMVSHDMTMRAIVDAWDEQVIRHLVTINFGRNAKYEIEKAEVNLAAMMPETPQGAKSPGGQGANDMNARVPQGMPDIPQSGTIPQNQLSDIEDDIRAKLAKGLVETASRHANGEQFEPTFHIRGQWYRCNNGGILYEVTV